MTYNGWTNYATWCVNLWATNEEVYCADYEEAGRQGPSALRAWVEEEMIGLDAMGACLVTDLLGSILDDVDWDELARASGYLDDAGGGGGLDSVGLDGQCFT